MGDQRETGRWVLLTSISYGCSAVVWRHDQPAQHFSHGLAVVSDGRAAFPRSVAPGQFGRTGHPS